MWGIWYRLTSVPDQPWKSRVTAICLSACKIALAISISPISRDPRDHSATRWVITAETRDRHRFPACSYTAEQSQKPVYAYFTSKQILPSDFAELLQGYTRNWRSRRPIMRQNLTFITGYCDLSARKLAKGRHLRPATIDHLLSIFRFKMRQCTPSSEWEGRLDL